MTTDIVQTQDLQPHDLQLMKSYPIIPNEKLLNIQTKKYRIKSLDILKKKVYDTKTQLDELFKKPMFPAYWKEFDPFKDERAVVAKMTASYNVSNAWLKCYELIEYYKMIPENINSPVFMHFDNAAFPGSFVLATHHYIKTRRSWSNKYVWRASSLVEENVASTALEDKYGLYAEYKSNWLMNAKNNGNVLSEYNQRDFHKQIGDKVDLYTSDLGLDFSTNYNDQEITHTLVNIGQIISGLVTLKPGGCFITKQYSYFEPTTISIIYAASTFFDKFYICKPYTSREANSEIYLVGIGFKDYRSDIFEHPYIKAMFSMINGKIPSDVPLFDAKEYPKEFLKTIISSANDIYTKQIDKINSDITRISNATLSGYRGHVSQNPVVLKFKESEEPKIELWYYTNPILPIEQSKMFKMKNALKQ